MCLAGLLPESIVQVPSPNMRSWWISRETSGYRAPPGETASKNLPAMGSSSVSSFFVYPSSPARGRDCGGASGGCGNTYNLTFSHDPGEKYILIADGNNNKLWIHDRKTGALVGSVGSYGTMAGQFHVIDAIAMDSHGNLYTGEVGSGKRVQKFILTNGDGKVRPR